MATNDKNLQDNLKKYFYSGVGLAAHAADAFQKSFKELARKGKVSEADGKRIVKEAIKKVEARRPEIEARYNATIHKFVKATTAEIAKLQKRIQQLEGQLKTKNSGPAPTQPRSGSSKKRATAKTKHTTRRKTAASAPANHAPTTGTTGTGETTTSTTAAD